MSRKQLAQIAHETLEILNRGRYVAPGGAKVRLDDSLRSACEHSVLYKPAMFPDVFARRDRLVANAAKWSTEFRVCSTSAGPGVLCLNFASAKRPGGGFLGGSQAQEESLARASGLYPCIVQFQEMYETNRRCGTCLYTDHMIYSPQVPVFRDDEGRLLEEPFLALGRLAGSVRAICAFGPRGSTDSPDSIAVATRCSRV
jgi:uncharacterized protein (TIGR02452 family)